MINEKVKLAIAGLLDIFREGNVPEKIAIATNPKFDVPSAKWSLNNRLIQLIYGTCDSRGIRQWGTVGRKVKKGAKASYILAPREFEFYQCACGTSLFHGDLEKKKCKQCDKEISSEEIKHGITFKRVPVFRAEDTEGKPLPYEGIPVPQHNFMNVAKAWGLEVKSSAFMGDVYGYYQDGKKIVLPSPEEEAFYHELAHAANFNTQKKRQDSQRQ